MKAGRITPLEHHRSPDRFNQTTVINGSDNFDELRKKYMTGDYMDRLG